MTFDVSCKVSFTFVCFMEGFSPIQPEPVATSFPRPLLGQWGRRGRGKGGKCPSFVT